jgi:site-specific DNA-cytosine methylase
MPNKGVGFVLTNQGELRAYSDQELATLGSFPTAFKWLANGVSERIGNSVPPLFMRAIADHIRAHILSAPVAMAAD